MKGNVSFIRPNDYLVPVGDTIGAKTVANWLGNDIQYSQRDVEEWLNVLSEVEAGKRKSGYQGTGNSHSVMIIQDVIYIECEYNDTHKVFITKSQFVDILNKYILFLRGGYKSSRVEVEPFTIEYEFEGDEALEQYINSGGDLV
ncbi:hypothetical protein [Vibrio gazogenes]|uniref:Uncharacterized protein n=1 Tax=Vibrio gazogenes TaxID=687 RepID=A0A1Z2SL26_VIBGA|nr:hypothetical protein [Vibrio gazogenes]ASA57898.1 hypothetical protein BSQ33_19495 [Vibrio gazogenes]